MPIADAIEKLILSASVDVTEELALYDRDVDIAEVLSSVVSSKTLLREVYKLTRICFTIPVTTATAERTFSALRRLKTFLRSTPSQPNLNQIMLLHIHKERTDRIDLEIAKEFISRNENHNT